MVTTLSVEALKRVFREPRPEGSSYSGYAFPSGHAALSFALAGVASRYHPRQRGLWYAIAIGVAWSRVEENAHNWQDVIAGAALGSYIGREAVAHGGLILAQGRW